MPSLSLKIVQDEGAVTRKVKFDSRMTVKEAHKLVKEKVIVPDKGKEYALFLRSADDDLTGVWLEDDRTLDYYMLRDGDSLDYICRVRNLRVRMMDDAVKTLQVDEAKTVGELMINVCARIGIANYDEYGLCQEEEEEADESKEAKEPATGTLTLTRKRPAKERDVALEQLSKKLKTDDNVKWLDQHRTLREQGIDSKETLLLKRRLFFSDRNVDSRDPLQLHLLYVQIRDAILNGRHIVTEQQAAEFAGIQCQVHFGDFQEKKHKPGFIENLEEYLPQQYVNAWGVEKKILKAYSQHQGLSQLDAKHLYIKTARDLPTYGVTFFLVKEKQKDKKKLVPRLLGINSESILRLDEVTKEILQQWPLTHVKTYHAGKSQTFTLNFGDYSDKEYSVKTQDAYRIRDILEGYIDIIRRRMLATLNTDPGDSMVICHDNVQPGKSHLIEHISNNPCKGVTGTFVGPTKILPFDQGSQAQQGTQIMTVQQIVVTDHLQNQQQAVKGEVPLRGDMSMDCVKKLNRMNSNSVKIVTLLTDPTDGNVKDAQRILENMQEDLPVVEKGIKETAEKQTVNDARKMLLDELQDLKNYMIKLADSTKPGNVNLEDAKSTAENIADLTTQMYFSIDPKTRRRSDIIRRSRKSFKEGEKTEQAIRRASFIAASTIALHSIDNAKEALHEDYEGSMPDDAQRKKILKGLEDRIGKLNAAVALYLTAQSDPENIDYASAIDCMNDINVFMPKLARDAQMLASTKEPGVSEALLDEMRSLFDATKKVCEMTGTKDHEKMQEASVKYADIAGKLIVQFARGTNSDTENEIIELATAAGDKASLLLVSTNELASQASSEPAAADLNNAGVRTAGATMDLLACSQLTALTINEPHCQSALTAAAESLASSVHHMETTWRPLVEDPTRQHMSEQLRGRAADVIKALERLKDSYAHLGDGADDSSVPLPERQRLKFISTIAGAKNQLQGVEDLWNKLATGTPSEQEKEQTRRRLEQQMAQLNAAVAALAAATADRENPDYGSGELAVSTITELMPLIIKDTEMVSSDKDEATRSAMLKQVQALCDASRAMCDGTGYQHGQGEAASNFAAASGKLMFLISPGVETGNKKQIMELSSSACDNASDLVSQVNLLKEHLDPDAAADLDTCAARVVDAAQALNTVTQVTASSIGEARCQNALASAVERLRESVADLTASCRPQLQQRPELQQQVLNTHRKLDDNLNKLVQACQELQGGTTSEVSPAEKENQRLKFINSMAGAKSRLYDAEQRLHQPILSETMTEEEGASLQRTLSQRLAHLNAAVARLAAATADRLNPDYAAADQAVNIITELMPQIVQDSRKLCGTKDDVAQAAMLREIKALCEASREICDSVEQQQDLGDAVAKFSDATGKMVFLVSPEIDDAQEKKIMNLSALVCGKASELLSQVQNITEQVKEPAAAADLDTRGSTTADAAQTLLTVAQLTAPSISEPSCSAALTSAAERLRNSAGDLTASCRPHLQQRPDLHQQVLTSHQHLDDSISKLVQACQEGQRGNSDSVSPAQQEKQRLKFISSISGAKNRLNSAEKQLSEPVVCQLMKPEDGAALQHKLSQRLAQLNAAVAALNAAIADGRNPDYSAAERAVTTITELIPQFVQDSRTLCGTKDEAGQAAMVQNLKTLCDASRDTCSSAGQPKKLHEASARLADASGKLIFLVSPGQNLQEKQVVDENSQARKKPALPVSDTKKYTIAHAVPSANRSGELTQDFLKRLRSEEGHDNEARITSADSKSPLAADDEKCVYKQFSQVIDNSERLLNTAEEELKVLYNAKSITVPGPDICAVEVANREQHMEDTLARAGVEVASLVAANYADKLDYKAAIEPTVALTKSVKSVVDDGGFISSSLHENARKPFIQDLTGLCEATKNICEAAKSKKEKLNDAAISFGDQSAKLLRVVSSDVNPALEKEVISRAKAIGDTASRLALEASNVASSASHEGDSHVQDICTAGAQCVDAAGKLVYTAKLVAPTIHHTTCQDALLSSADNLSSFLTTFSNTWKPLAATQQPNVQKLTEEAGNLEKLLEKLRSDVKAGKLGKRREVDRLVMVDYPLRRMTMQIIDNAKNMAEHGELKPELKKEYINYSNRLAEALRALDLANARCQRAPHDKTKQNQMELAIQDLQMALLQTRPSRSGQEQNNIVDFRDFLQDLVKEVEKLQETATRNQGPAGKKATDDIKLLCSKISEDATRLLSPSDHHGDGMMVMTSVDDIMDIDQFGKECDDLVKEIHKTIQGIQDQKAKQALRAKALPLTESCNLLRFATNSHIAATKSVAFEEALQDLDNFKTNVMRPLVNEVMKNKKEKVYVTPLGCRARARGARSNVVAASREAGARAGPPRPLPNALAYYATCAAAVAHDAEPFLQHLDNVLCKVQDVTSTSNLRCANWDEYEASELTSHDILYQGLDNLDYNFTTKPEIQVLNEEDIRKLLICDRVPVEGTQKQLEDKVQQLSTKLNSMSGTIVLSVKKPNSLSRSLHAAADTATQLANTARALKDHKKPVQNKIIEDAAHEMSLATYSLLKTSELVCQDPNHHDSRRKLLEACHHLNDSISKLVRSVNPAGKLLGECSEAHRSLQLQRSVLQTTPQPCGALPYAHCVDTLYSQRDVLRNLNSDHAMPRQEFLKSMHYITSAVNNSTECAAQATYLLSVSEKDESIGKQGIVDVSKLHKAVRAVQDTCISIIMARHEDQIQEEKKVLESHVQELLDSLEESSHKIKDGDLKKMLEQCRQDVDVSAKSFYQVVQQNKPKVIMCSIVSLMDDVTGVASLIEHSDLVPIVSDVSAETQASCDEIVKNSLALLTNTEELIKQVKSSPDEPEMMSWVMFNKRKDVLDAFDALLKRIKSHGQRAKLLEGSTEDSEEEKKSYVQIQFNTASKWLLKPMSKAEVKTNGQQAVRNLIDVANKVTEDLTGNDEEDMRHLIMETEQLLTECSEKYDHEQYSVLMERVRELKKGIERGVVTRVVEDFMDAEAPLADLDILADAERDETKRKFLLEKKIAELLAQLSRVTKTARLIADTDADGNSTVSTQLNTCSQQAELLAPMLVKAAQQRVASPDDKVVIENYKSLLARYAESLSKIRDLCDQSVDPMDFVQTAGETMQRMREESTKHNDPMKCAYTSTAITKLANRVIHVGMLSSTARSDPELRRALSEAQRQLSEAAPPPHPHAHVRRSGLRDWKDTTAKILQATEEVESLLGGETIFKKQPEPNQPIYNEALNLHVAIRDWSSRDNEIVAVAKRMAVLMAKLSNFMNNDKQHEVLATSKSIVTDSHEVARLAKKLAHECTDHRIKTNLLQACERIPTISAQLKMLTTVKGFSLGRHGTQEDKEAMDMLVGNAQSLMLSIQDVVKGAASASVKIMSQRGLRMKWVRKNTFSNANN